MAFLKYANASVIHTDVNMSVWTDKRLKSVAPIKKASVQSAIYKFDPTKYMLSHATIVASVDTEDAHQPLGQHLVGGVEIDRRYSDFYVTPKTARWINNNNDCFERKLLLSSFPTFIGANNYLEHIQIPELAKGRIIDAAARDIGDSVYVDILVATSLKHKPLVKAIRDKRLSTLSMGCTVQFTICTKCGNVAFDESQLCPCVKYGKGTTFLDHSGVERKISELCGHIDSEPGSVLFIDGSWVAHPAFTGAVMRNILEPDELALAGLGQKLRVAFSNPAPKQDANMLKAAKLLFDDRVGQQQFGDPSQGEDAAPVEDSPFNKAIEDIADLIREKALDKVRQEMAPKEVPSADLQIDQNNTLIKEAAKNAVWRRIAKIVLTEIKRPAKARRIFSGLILHRHGGWQYVRGLGLSCTEMLIVSRFLDRFNRRAGCAGESRLYRTVLAVGGVGSYQDTQSYFAACRQVIGRTLTDSEKELLLVKGRIYDLGTL